MNNNQIDWSNFLVDNGLSLEEEINNSLAMSEYLIKSSHNKDEFVDEKNILIFDFDTLALDNLADFKMPIDSYELFDIFSKTEYELINPMLPFPKIKSLDNAFILLFNLSKVISTHTHLVFINITEQTRAYIDSLLYFGFLKENLDNEFLITAHLKKTKNLDNESIYLLFLKRIASSKSLNNIFKLLLSSETFDNINRAFIKEDLLADRSIIEEQITPRELDLIIRNMRLWYIAIRQKLIL